MYMSLHFIKCNNVISRVQYVGIKIINMIIQYCNWNQRMAEWLWDITVSTFASSGSSLSTSYNSTFHMRELPQPSACYNFAVTQMTNLLKLYFLCHTCPPAMQWLRPPRFQLSCEQKSAASSLLWPLWPLCISEQLKVRGQQGGQWDSSWRTMSLRVRTSCGPALGGWVTQSSWSPGGLRRYISHSYSRCSGASPVIAERWVTPRSAAFLFVSICLRLWLSWGEIIIGSFSPGRRLNGGGYRSKAISTCCQ